MRVLSLSLWILLSFGLFTMRAAGADNWPQFRGPQGNGNASDTKLPLSWSIKTGENILWSTDLDGEGLASPIVWGNRIFVLNATKKSDPKAVPTNPEHFLVAYDVKTGDRQWSTIVPPGPWKRRFDGGRLGGGFASCTPATDGEHVFVLCGTSVLSAIDFQGKIVWRKELVPHAYDMEMATSPIVFESTVIVFCGMQGGSRLVAFDRKTGEIVWDKTLKDTGYGHNTPLITKVKGAPHLVLMGGGLSPAKNAIQGFDPRTGDRLWWCAGNGETASAIQVNDFIYGDSGRGGPGKLIDPGGKGDVTESHVKWVVKTTNGLSSPLAMDNLVYRLNDGGVLSCWDAKTGEKVYAERVAQLSSTWASPIADGNGRIYLASAGTTVVVQAGPTFKLLSSNPLGDNNHASAAVANGKIFLLGAKKLYAIGSHSKER